MPAPLDGIKVLDFTRFQAGPTATVLLSDLGADIVKVEIPGQGDQGRYIHAVEGVSATPYFIAHDRGKRGITVDFRSPQGKEILLKIGEGCDVVVENFRPGYTEKIGLGYEAFRARNEGIVYAAVSAYGEEGPLGNLTGFDILGHNKGEITLHRLQVGCLQCGLGFGFFGPGGGKRIEMHLKPGHWAVRVQRRKHTGVNFTKARQYLLGTQPQSSRASRVVP